MSSTKAGVVLGLVSHDFYFKHAVGILFFFCFDCETCSNFCFSVAEQNKSVYLLDNCPHDWPFPRCTAVVPAKFFSVEILFFFFI